MILLSVAAATADNDNSRVPKWETEAQIGQPLFNAETYKRLNLNGEDTRVDIVAEIMHDMLQFVRHGDSFRAAVEFSLSISIQDAGQIKRDVILRTVEVEEFDETNSRRDFITGYFSVNLPHGEYRMLIQILDKESKQRQTLKREVIIEPSKENSLFKISDILLTRSSEVDLEASQPTYPTTSGLVPDKSSTLFCYFDLYRAQPSGVAEISMSVYDKTGAVVYLDSLSIVGGDNLTSYFMPIHCNELSFGKYKVLLRAQMSGIGISRETTFSVNFHGLPSTIRELNLAINQLKYIAKEAEIKRLREEFPSKRERAFLKFWNENFPSENEIVNSKMVEYYNRVADVNELYSGSRDGWETDRGMIYIIYGKPSEIEQHSFEDNAAPYEVWHYHHLGKRLLFRDDYGFGDYRLVSPVW